MSKKKFNINNFNKETLGNHKISMITVYDYTSATIANKSTIDCLLVGDSAAIVMSGYNDTTSASIDLIEYHTKSVKRGAPDKFIIADMPFLSYRKDKLTAINCAEKLIKAGANAVKIEAVYGHEDIISHLIQSGIPVMGHIGLTPQYINSLGSYTIQGKSVEQQKDLIQQAKLLEELQCFCIVLECIPISLTADITHMLKIPTIGIGSGIETNGQVLVWHDLLGLTDYSNFKKKPKFVKEYLNSRELFCSSLNQFHCETQNQTYPNEEYSYQ